MQGPFDENCGLISSSSSDSPRCSQLLRVRTYTRTIYRVLIEVSVISRRDSRRSCTKISFSRDLHLTTVNSFLNYKKHLLNTSLIKWTPRNLDPLETFVTLIERRSGKSNYVRRRRWRGGVGGILIQDTLLEPWCCASVICFRNTWALISREIKPVLYNLVHPVLVSLIRGAGK